VKKTHDYLADLRKKDVDDVRELLTKRRTELMELRFSQATGALENPARLGDVRREIARIQTVLNERRVAGATAE
jgi:large subunit ribosomal protein L29